MCDRKYMFVDKSTFCTSKNGQNIPKKRQQEKNIFLDSSDYNIFFSRIKENNFLFNYNPHNFFVETRKKK